VHLFFPPAQLEVLTMCYFILVLFNIVHFGSNTTRIVLPPRLLTMVFTTKAVFSGSHPLPHSVADFWAEPPLEVIDEVFGKPVAVTVIGFLQIYQYTPTTEVLVTINDQGKVGYVEISWLRLPKLPNERVGPGEKRSGKGP
jgi:hypothetical protein